MNVCDCCKKEIDGDKTIYLRFDSYWIPDLGVRKEFCSLVCVKNWLEGKIKC